MKTSFPKNKIRMLLLEGIHDAGAAMLADEGFDVDLRTESMSSEELIAALDDVHVLGIRSRSQVDAAVLENAQRLLAVGCFCIGTNQVDLGAARTHGVPVFNSPFSNTRSVAELTIAEIVALHRRLADRTMQMHRGEWQKSAVGAHEVRGRTLGIVGYGRIGSQVSVLAEAMGMHVRFFDVQPVLALGNARGFDSLSQVLSQSDVVSLHVPATDQTVGMIGATQLREMKSGSFLINNARGNVVDVDALAGAIRDGHLAGAAFDVFPEEPAAGSPVFHSPLCGLPNVIMTPHVGGSTQEAQRAIAEDVARKVMRFINIGSTTGAVNVPEVDLPEQSYASGDPSQRPHRILNFHHNRPGVLSKIHAAISDVGANISAEYLRTQENVGYVVLDVDPSDAEAIVERLDQVDETIRQRLLW